MAQAQPWPGFLGTSYASEASSAAIEKTVNWYQESAEVPNLSKGLGPWLMPRAGLVFFGNYPVGYATWLIGTTYALFAMVAKSGILYRSLQGGNVGNTPLTSPAWWLPLGNLGRARGKIAFNGTAYAVIGTSFVEIAANGAMTLLGQVADDGLPVTMAAGKPSTTVTTGQLAIASGGQLYIYAGGNFTPIASDPVNGPLFGADYVTWLDGYFVVLQRALSQFQLSALGDGTLWNAASISGTLGQADTIQAIIANQEYLYLLGGGVSGGGRGEIWYNAGGALFPFAIESGAFIEDGIGANNSLVRSHDSVYWLDQSERGGVVAVRAEGLVARRISTHPIEEAWSNKNPDKGKVYATVADCVTYSYIWKGHTIIRWIFPTADATWDYDSTESDACKYPVWNEVTFTDALGKPHAVLERDHCYQYGLHIVGSGGADGLPGTYYTLDDSTYTDGALSAAVTGGAAFAGYPIIRDRIVRLPWNQGLRQILDRLELFLQVGVGLDTGQGADPQIMLRISRNGGKTWGPEGFLSIGAGGAYQTRVIANRLGSYRDGALWLRISDPVFAALTGAAHYIRSCGS